MVRADCTKYPKSFNSSCCFDISIPGAIVCSCYTPLCPAQQCQSGFTMNSQRTSAASNLKTHAPPFTLVRDDYEDLFCPYSRSPALPHDHKLSPLRSRHRLL